MIPVIWHSQTDGRGFYNCTALLNWMFDKYKDLAHFTRNDLSAVADRNAGAVFIVHGGRQLGEIDLVNRDIEKFEYVLVILLGDEECSFPFEQLEHQHMMTWVQEPMPGRHDSADRYIIDGFTPYTEETSRIAVVRDYDWFFAGQVTHERRRACVQAMQSMSWGGVIIETKGYCQGISQTEYQMMLRRAKFVPCPSGPFSPDAARPWEALQMGAIPILDDLSPTRHEPGFWKYVLGNHPLPVLTDWAALPETIEVLKRGYSQKQFECITWWAKYCQDFCTWLEEDWKALRKEFECSLF